MRTISLYMLLLVALALPSVAQAAREPRPIQLDHRVRIVMYQPDQVYRFTGHYRFQSAIEFGQGEEIATISMGDSTAWMLNPSGNRLFLKPVDQDATTNMTIITNRHTYLFELHGRETNSIEDPDMIFIMRFIYPDGQDMATVSNYLDSVPIPDPVRDAGGYNFNYTISGTDLIAPIKIFDDGQFTYFQFKNKNADIPAFFLVSDTGEESLINYRTRGDYIVIERVGERFTLRHGKDIVCVFNEAMRAPKRLAANQ